MGKAKLKAATSIPNRHVYTRLSYLHQAASYLTNVESVRHTSNQPEDPSAKQNQAGLKTPSAQSRPQPGRSLLTHIRGISHKARVRLQPGIKRAICKRCDAMLIPGQTSTASIENASSGGQKPWADVLVLRCNECQTVKRFPVGQARNGKNTRNNVKKAGGYTPDVIAGEKVLHKEDS